MLVLQRSSVTWTKVGDVLPKELREKMGNWRDSIPSKWLKASDLEGKPRLVTIKKFTEEKLQGETFPKPAVWFKEEEKALILNITNGKKIEQICGTGDPDGWTGKRIVIYPTETELRGETVDCIRVRAPKPGTKPPVPEPEETEDHGSDSDDTPF